MTTKHRRSGRGRAADGQAGTQLIRIVGIGIVIVVVAALAWMLLPKPAAPKETLSWDAPPAMAIDLNHKYKATVKMEKGGEFVIALYPDKAPITVNSFVFLAR